MNKEGHRTAADVVNEYTEEQLADIFYLYGEFRQSRRMAAAVVKARQLKPIATTEDLKEVVGSTLQRGREKKTWPACSRPFA